MADKPQEEGNRTRRKSNAKPIQRLNAELATLASGRVGVFKP